MIDNLVSTLIQRYVSDIREIELGLFDGEVTPELSRMEYRPYRGSNHALSCLYYDIRVDMHVTRYLMLKSWRHVYVDRVTTQRCVPL